MEVFKSKGLECQLYNESEVEGIDGLDVVMFTGGGKVSKQLKKLKSEIINRILSKGEIDIVINITCSIITIPCLSQMILSHTYCTIIFKK